MQALQSWILRVVGTAFLVFLLQGLMPEGSVKKIGGMAGGVLLLLVLLTPFSTVRLEQWDLSFSDYAGQVQQQTRAYRQEQNQQWQTLIQENTAAYIKDKAEQLGLSCRVTVKTELGEDEVPYPAGVVIEGEKNQELSEYMEQQLGIPEEAQVWTE